MRECHCLICAGEVAGDGWQVVDSDSYVYTVGLWHSFGSAEVAMFGLAVPEMAAWAEVLSEEAAAGRILVPDGQRDDVLGAFPVFPRPALASWHRRLFPEALRVYRGQPVPVVQVVWGDGGGRPPWDPACDEACRLAQPRLWDRPPPAPGPGDGWSFPVSPDTLVMTTGAVGYGGAAVTVVVHDEDGEWQFLDGNPEMRDVAFVHLAHVVEAAPEVAVLADLPSGWEAQLEAGRWVRRPLDDE